MTLIKKLFGAKEPQKRVHVCVECGMPVAEHKSWCSILRLREQYAEAAGAEQRD